VYGNRDYRVFRLRSPFCILQNTTFRKLDLFPLSGGNEFKYWNTPLNGTNRTGVSHSLTWRRKQIQLSKRCVIWISGRFVEPKHAAILKNQITEDLATLVGLAWFYDPSTGKMQVHFSRNIISHTHTHTHTHTRARARTHSVAWVRERTMPAEQPPLVSEVGANFCGERGVTWSVRQIPMAVFSIF
jgi:hypothetical protein